MRFAELATIAGALNLSFASGLIQKPSLRSCKTFAPTQSSKLVAPALRPYGGF